MAGLGGVYLFNCREDAEKSYEAKGWRCVQNRGERAVGPAKNYDPPPTYTPIKEARLMITPKEGSAQGGESAQQLSRKYRMRPKLARTMMAGNLASEFGYIKLGDLIDPKQPKALDRLLGSGLNRLNFKAGDRVYPLLRRDPALLIVERGTLSVFLDDEPDRFLIKQLEPNAVFGEMTSLGLKMFGAVVEAATAARVIAIGKTGVDRIEARLPRFLRGWMKVLGPRHSETKGQSILCKYGSPRSQVVHDLLHRADGRLVVESTQQEIAARLGLARLSVSVVLRDLRRQGIISIHRGSIDIEDLQGLCDLALF
jgi:CRP-like cAMP-binding protein